jgi:NTE family protein
MYAMVEQRMRIGIALGGGVVRGLAHIGVLQVLVEAGIPIALVSGASAGAIIGAAYCAGLSLPHMAMLARQLRWDRLLRPSWPSRGLFSFEPLARLLVRELGELDFADLHLPFAVSAVNIETGQPVILRSGSVARAVQASCAIPGVIAPVEIDGALLADGHFGDAVPVRALRQMGADYVIGVDIMQPTLRRRLGFLGYGSAALEIILQRAGRGVDEADCLVQPNLAGKTYLRFSRREALIHLGALAARDKLGQITADLVSLAGQPIHHSMAREAQEQVSEAPREASDTFTAGAAAL